MSSFFWTIMQGLITVGFLVIWIGWEYQGLYTGFVCWIFETIWVGVFTLNIINIFEND